jgi:glutamine amidotransferase
MPPQNPLIAVVDFGAGNLRSVAKALERSQLETRVVSDPAAVRRADAVVLPGVGAFADAVSNLRAKGLDDAVRESIASGRPYLGLCLGLQVLFEESDEHGPNRGLGLLRGRVDRFAERDADGRPLRVPHIGWNGVRFRGSHPMLERLPSEDCYYFVHSYKAAPAEAEVAVGVTDYGGEFAAAVARDNVFAVQFHPEKSQGAGRKLLDAFGAWVRSCG